MASNGVARRPVLIAGPTASGKSAFALRLAERDGGCIINADAAQVYACWRILTARPDDADLARAPHLLYGHVSCATRYSVGAWIRDVAAAMAEAEESRKRVIIVGGTGLYLSALLDGLTEIPAIQPEVRARSQALLDAGRIDVLLDDLTRGDPVTLERLDKRNPVRLQRAWEVLFATGRGLAAWHDAHAAAPLISKPVTLVLNPDTSLLNKRIEDRFRQMLDLGALDECRSFLLCGLPSTLPSARVLGASQLCAHLSGELPLEAAIADAVTATRRFAKRQRTWFRGRMKDWTWVDPDREDPLAAIPET